MGLAARRRHPAERDQRRRRQRQDVRREVHRAERHLRLGRSVAGDVLWPTCAASYPKRAGARRPNVCNRRGADGHPGHSASPADQAVTEPDLRVDAEAAAAARPPPPTATGRRRRRARARPRRPGRRGRPPRRRDGAADRDGPARERVPRPTSSREVGKVVVGQRDMVERVLIGLLADGHCLIEGVPGPGQDAHGQDPGRRPSTPLPAHPVHARPPARPTSPARSIYNMHTGQFTQKRGPLFANLVLADEVNRAPAKVQSALLEAMQERQVTIGDVDPPRCPIRSWSSRPRTRSSRRARSRCPRPSSTASCC